MSFILGPLPRYFVGTNAPTSAPTCRPVAATHRVPDTGTGDRASRSSQAAAPKSKERAVHTCGVNQTNGVALPEMKDCT